MPKVKLTANRVCHVPESPRRFISESAGHVVDVSNKEATNLIAAGQAVLVEGETIEIDDDEEGDLDPDASDLVLLELDPAVVAVLEAADETGNVPAFGSLSELVIWVQTEGNLLSNKKGIGKATETKVLDAIDAWVEAQTPTESDEPGQTELVEGETIEADDEDEPAQ